MALASRPQGTAAALTVALCIGNAVGDLSLNSQAAWVATLTRDRVLSTANVGWLACGEVLASVAATLTLSIRRQLRFRSLVLTGAALATLANAIAMFPAPSAVVLGRMLNGVGIGTLYATVNRLAATSPDAQRLFALMHATGVGVSSAVYFALPALIAYRGTAGLFGVMGSVAVVSMLVSAWGLRRAPSAPVQAANRRIPMRLAPSLACTGFMVVALGVSAVFTYVVTVGTAHGMPLRTVSTALAVTLPLALIGPIAARIVGERWGLIAPLLTGLMLLSIAFFLIANASSAAFFAIAAGLLYFSVGFFPAYAMALVSSLDSSGRSAGVAGAFYLIGAASGPKIGGLFVEAARFQTLAAVAATCLAVGMALFRVAVWRNAIHESVAR